MNLPVNADEDLSDFAALLGINLQRSLSPFVLIYLNLDRNLSVWIINIARAFERIEGFSTRAIPELMLGINRLTRGTICSCVDSLMLSENYTLIRIQLKYLCIALSM